MDQYRDKINIVKNKSHTSAYLNGTKFFIRENYMGRRTKFWLNDGKINKYLVKWSEYSSNRADVAEIFYCKLAKKAGLNPAESEFAVFNENNKKTNAVLIKNFLNENDTEIKISSLILRERKRKQLKEINSVENYCNLIEKYYPNHVRSVEINMNDIKTDLKKMAVLDYMSGQLDRCSLNVSLISTYDKNETIKIKSSPIFDNAYSVISHFPVKLIKSFVKYTNYDNLITYFKENKNHKSPAIYARILINNMRKAITNSKVLLTITDNKNRTKDFAMEILKDPELYDFYKKAATINTKAICDEMHKVNKEIPTYLLDFAQITYQLRIQNLEKEMNSILKKENPQKNMINIKQNLFNMV